MRSFFLALHSHLLPKTFLSLAMITFLFAMPVHAASQKGEDGITLNGATWENSGVYTGASGEDSYNHTTQAGTGGNGVVATNSSLLNKAGGVISGGRGGFYKGAVHSDYNLTLAGDGGVGVLFRTSGGKSYSLVNYGEIHGAHSGQDIYDVTKSAIGAAGVHIVGDGNVLVNYGSIYGGNAIMGSGGQRVTTNQAVMITGDRNHIINAGIIQSGYSTMVTPQYATAILITGNDNIVELRGDYFLNEGSGSGDYAIASLGSVGNTIALGGDITEGRVFDQADIAKFSCFDTLAKFGESNWTVTGATSATMAWNVYGGKLNVDFAAKISGSNVYEGVLEFEADAVVQKLGVVEVFGAGMRVGPGGKIAYYSGGALPLGRGGTATSVTLRSGATAHAYSNNQYLVASGAITVEDGLKFYFKSNDWVDGQEYRMLQGASANIDPAYLGDGKYYSLAGYDFRAFQSGTDALHIQMLRAKNLSDNPDLSYNQEKTGDRVDSLPDGDPLKDIVKHTETDKLPDVLDQLSGEIYATLPTVIRNHDTRLRNSMLSSISRNALANMLCKTPQGDDPCQKKDDATGKLFTDPVCREKREAESSCPSNDLWISGGWNYSRESATNNVGMSEFTGPEVALGVDTLFGKGWGAGVFFRYSDKELELASRRSEANVRSFNFGGYGTKSMDAGDGSLRFTLGGIYGYHDIRTERHVKFSSTIADVDEEVQSGHTAHTLSAFTEIAWALPVMENLWLEPFANIAYTNTRTGSARETGGNMTALRVSSATQDNVDTRLGLRAAVPFAEWGKVNAELGWQHTFGDNEPKVGIGFKNGGKSYPIKGSKIARDAATIGLGLSAGLSESVTLDLTYDGVIGENSQSHTGQLMFSYHF